MARDREAEHRKAMEISAERGWLDPTSEENWDRLRCEDIFELILVREKLCDAKCNPMAYATRPGNAVWVDDVLNHLWLEITKSRNLGTL
jgi:hypothetical protein